MIDDKSVNDRLIEFCKQKGITGSQLARDLGVSRQTVNGWFKYRNEIGVKYVSILKRKYLELNTLWMAQGEGEMILTEDFTKSFYEKEILKLKCEIDLLKKVIEEYKQDKYELYKQIGRLELLLEIERQNKK